MEIDFDRDLHAHRVTIFHGRLEDPILYGFDRLFIQPHSQAAQHANLTWSAVGADDQAKSAGPLIFRLAGFFGEFRVDLVNHPRRGNSTADVEDAATNPAAFTRTKSRSFARTNAATFSAADSASGTGAVRRKYCV